MSLVTIFPGLTVSTASQWLRHQGPAPALSCPAYTTVACTKPLDPMLFSNTPNKKVYTKQYALAVYFLFWDLL